MLHRAQPGTPLRASRPARYRPRQAGVKPLNPDHERYSHCSDGDSKPPLSAQVCDDDVLPAGDGGFLGLATDH